MMEEAYTALYQEFLRLQALCLKQAAMLQHLTEALRRQQGLTPVSNGELEDLVSIPVQCTDDDHENLNYPHVCAQAAQTQPLTLHTGGNTDISPVTGAMYSLQLDTIPGETRLKNQDKMLSVESQTQNEAPESSIVEELRQAEEKWHSSQPPKHARRPWSSSFLNSEILSQAGGLQVSGFTLQSQVCEFCHAVFPGHTTTAGDFLRHLTTHTS
ncbi:uncharacterized protein zgc:113184 isoform X1 [Hoplias malabaricus]|uniref:uncharacterized protein zgc:113184 isoform X1 n=1 Tax=Hoplias malabaricus TaxID=27720 RepID=UPI003462ED37